MLKTEIKNFDIIINATSLGLKNGNDFDVDGVLTIKGISHPISFVLSVDNKVATSKFTFDRSKYDVRFRSGTFFENLGDKLILDDIDLRVISGLTTFSLSVAINLQLLK